MTLDLPNIVLVVLDTARRDRFGCYGYNKPTTPNVDSLARDGLLVERMFANAPWTPPSHASLFTGLYPSEHGCQWGEEIRLQEGVGVTMAEWLKTFGYETVCVTNNGLISPATGLTRGFDSITSRFDLERGVRRTARRLRKGLFGGDGGGGIINRHLRGALQRVRRPMFLFVNFLEPHWAYVPRPSVVRRVGGPRFRFPRGLHYRLRIADKVGPWEAIARADRERLDIYSTLYDGEVASADMHFGRLMETLDRTGHLRRDTIVMVTSDHGEHIGEHGLADHHASLDDHIIDVPFVAWGPGLVERGSRGGMWELVDVFGSLARLIDQPVPAPYLEGRRSSLLVGDAAESNPHAFAEWRSWNPKELGRLSRRNPSYDFAPIARDIVSVRDERFKLVRGSDGSELLFDCRSDPDEETDVSSSHPEVAGRLRAELDAAVASWSPPSDAGGSGYSEAERKQVEEQLSALGYI
jgi:arylsulfatase A-like enzyme